MEVHQVIARNVVLTKASAKNAMRVLSCLSLGFRLIAQRVLMNARLVIQDVIRPELVLLVQKTITLSKLIIERNVISAMKAALVVLLVEVQSIVRLVCLAITKLIRLPVLTILFALNVMRFAPLALVELLQIVKVANLDITSILVVQTSVYHALLV